MYTYKLLLLHVVAAPQATSPRLTFINPLPISEVVDEKPDEQMTQVEEESVLKTVEGPSTQRSETHLTEHYAQYMPHSIRYTEAFVARDESGGNSGGGTPLLAKPPPMHAKTNSSMPLVDIQEESDDESSDDDAEF